MKVLSKQIMLLEFYLWQTGIFIFFSLANRQKNLNGTEKKYRVSYMHRLRDKLR